MQKSRTIWIIMQREVKRLVQRPVYIFCMIIAPLFCYIFFTTLMGNGLPVDIPAGVVDEDNSSITRQIIRNLDAFQQTKIVNHYANFAEARKAMQKGKIYALYYIPKGTTAKALANKQPVVSFYTASTYLIPASLEYRDMKIMSEYASGSIGRAALYAKGYTEDQAIGILQPIKMEMHAVNNPRLNYSIYLNNTLLPGILMLIIFQVTIYSIYSEIKENTAGKWLALAHKDIYKALIGKLIPQSIIFLMMSLLYLVILYGYWHFPMNSGFWPMLLATFISVIVSQACGVFFCGLLPSLRWALSLATLWGVLSFPISGFSFPEMSFSAPLKSLSYLFPLRHYFLIYVNQALNGLPIVYSWANYLALILFMLLPLLVMRRLKYFMLNYHYTR